MTYYYDLLGVKQSATPKELKKAYEKLYSKHEAAVLLKDPKQRDKYFAGWLMIEEAYDILSNPNERAKYDKQLDILSDTNITQSINLVLSVEEHGKQALEILNTMAYFFPKDIPAPVFLELFYCDGDSTKSVICALDLLRDCGLISLKEEQGQLLVDIPNVVQHHRQLKFKKQDLEETVLSQAISLLEDTTWNLVWYKRGDHEMSFLYPHVKHIRRHTSEYPKLWRRSERLEAIMYRLIHKQIHYQQDEKDVNKQAKQSASI